MYLKGQKLEVALHSLLSEYKNVQESVLTNVNIQRTGKTSLQMECEYTKNWKNVFADVCIFYF